MAIGLEGDARVDEVVLDVRLDGDARTVGFLDYESLGSRDDYLDVRPEVYLFKGEYRGVYPFAVEVVARDQLALAVLAAHVVPRGARRVDVQLADVVVQGLFTHVSYDADRTVADLDVAEYDCLFGEQGDPAAAAGLAC